MTPLPPAFLGPPIAHRAYHDRAAGRPENSRAAVRAAVERGYGIEIDLQLSQDGQAMVFHDYDLRRLTPAAGAIRQRTAADLARIPLIGGDETIPGLPEILALVAGRAPLLIEIKDQDGTMGPDIGALERAAAAALADYAGPVALMSFNPHSAAALAGLCPDRAVGLVTSAYTPEEWGLLPAERRDRLRAMPDAERCAFISHQASDLDRPRVGDLKAAGKPVLCWTIRSPQAEAEARRIADNVTFEGYAAQTPTP